MKYKILIITMVLVLLVGNSIFAMRLNDYEEEAIESLKIHNLNQDDLKYYSFQRTESYIARDYRLGKISKEEGVRLIKEGREKRALESGYKIIRRAE